MSDEEKKIIENKEINGHIITEDQLEEAMKEENKRWARRVSSEVQNF